VTAASPGSWEESADGTTPGAAGGGGLLDGAGAGEAGAGAGAADGGGTTIGEDDTSL